MLKNLLNSSFSSVSKNLLLCILTFSFPIAVQAQMISLPIKIMPLGNSITYDNITNDTRPIEDKVAYRRKLYDLLQANGYEPGVEFDFVGSQKSGPTTNFDPDNQGQGGQKTEGAANEVYNYLTQNPADIILLHLGTNDLVPNPTISASVDNMARLLDEIDRFENQTGREITVIISRIINRSTYHEQTTIYNDSLEIMVRQRITSAEPDDLILVDMEDGAGINYSTEMVDVFHPTPAGYAKMGELWYEKLKPVLDRKINEAQGAPVITSSPVPGARIGEAYTYQVTASGSPAPTYTLTAAPSGMAINATSGLITFNPTEERQYNITVKASNGSGENEQSFVLSVSNVEDCPDGLQQYYTLDEETGTSSYVDSFNGNNGIPSANPPTSSTDAVVGNSQSFNGTDNFIVVEDDPSLDFSQNQSFTIELWAKFTNVDGENKVMIGRDQFSLRPHWWLGALSGTGKAHFNLVEDGSNRGVAVTSTTSVNDNEWHHIVAVRDNSTNMNRIYVDGVEEDAAAYDYTLGFAANTTVGIGYMSFEGTSRYFYEGLLDEIAVHDKALTPGEIRNQYNKGIAGAGKCEDFTPGPGPVTGIIDDLEENGLMVYPVPAENNLNIEFNDGQTGTITLTILDKLGRTAFRKDVSLVGQQNKLNLDLASEDLMPGLYILRVESSKFPSGRMIKFIKK